MIQKKALPFKIPKTTSSSLILQIDQEPYFYDKLHQHQEHQLTLILSGSGTIVHGEYVGQFEEGDVLLIGSNVPHVFRCDQSYYNEDKNAHSISVFFDEQQLKFLVQTFPEFSDFSSFLNQANLGAKAVGYLKSNLAEKIQLLFELNQFERLIRFFELLHELSKENDWIPLLDRSAKRVREQDGKRLDDIFTFTLSNYQRSISIEEIADIANMNKSSFCRYFKQHTRKSYIDFLNEYRIHKACSLLADPDQSIAQIAYEVGFSNLSNFNRQFKRVKKETPREFKSRLSVNYS